MSKALPPPPSEERAHALDRLMRATATTTSAMILSNLASSLDLAGLDASGAHHGAKNMHAAASLSHAANESSPHVVALHDAMLAHHHSQWEGSSHHHWSTHGGGTWKPEHPIAADPHGDWAPPPIEVWRGQYGYKFVPDAICAVLFIEWILIKCPHIRRAV